MILLDVNVLVYAARREFDQHETARAWLATSLGGAESVAVSDEVSAAAVRILTNHRVLSQPSTSQQAMDFVTTVRTAPSAVQPLPSVNRWRHFDRLVREQDLRANAIPDALLAATALDLNADLATFDRSFTRFPGLRVLVLGAPGARP